MKRHQAGDQRPSRALPRMMIAFIVRRCGVELGHAPTPLEFATWANAHGDAQSRHLFGRRISEDEARIILKHQARLVSAKSARPEEEFVSEDERGARPQLSAGAFPSGAKVIRLAEARLRSRPKRRMR